MFDLSSYLTAGMKTIDASTAGDINTALVQTSIISARQDTVTQYEAGSHLEKTIIGPNLTHLLNSIFIG